jgi:hypothetical protein
MRWLGVVMVFTQSIRTGDDLSSRSSEVVVPLSLKMEACEREYRDRERPICRGHT